MDLIYMNRSREDEGVLADFTFDLAFGKDENNFECVVDTESHCCEEGYFLYYEGTEYGGIIDKIKVATDKSEITYIGRTWHGLLEAKIIEPDGDYLILSGEANAQLAFLIDRMDLSGLFKASSEESGIDISNYKMNRYIGGYEGIRKMLRDAGAKLHIEFKEGFAELSARPLVDYSKDEEFDTDQIDFVIEKNFHPINHVICLGAGNLSEREVIHVYADASGNISTTQSIFGIDEVTAKYDNPNAESSEALMQGGIDLIKASWNADKVDFDFNSNEKTYDIGDVVGAREFTTGISASSEIVKKIVKIKDNTTTISYEVGEV